MIVADSRGEEQAAAIVGRRNKSRWEARLHCQAPPVIQPIRTSSSVQINNVSSNHRAFHLLPLGVLRGGVLVERPSVPRCNKQCPNAPKHPEYWISFL